MTPYNLFGVVIESSVSDDWNSAKDEWVLSNSTIANDETCICGKLHIKNCFTLRNILNGHELYPVGSECVKKFENNRMLANMKIAKMGENILKSGKHKGRSYQDVVRNEPEYIDFFRHKVKITNNDLKKLVAYAKWAESHHR